ncbi:MAG: hypothetical protein LBC12_04485 [Nitrososphaerota archaeon]|jgi:hypothetical protein|nr:hypothetical protein [Nitrososphaerota archaeon]
MTDYCDFIDIQAQSPTKLNAKISSLKGVKETRARFGPDKTQAKVWKGLSLKPLTKEIVETNENEEPQTNLTDFETSETSETSFIPKKIFEEKNNIGIKLVSSVSSVPLSQNASLGEGSEVAEVYSQLCCVFCQKGIMDNGWMQDDFSWNKPAHKSCYDTKRSELAELDRRENF